MLVACDVAIDGCGHAGGNYPFGLLAGANFVTLPCQLRSMDARGHSGRRGAALGLVSRNSVGEFYAEDDFRQLVVAIEAAPAFLGSLGELEDHGERGLVRETSF